MTTRGKFARVLLKLSGEALGGEQGFGRDAETFQKLAEQISRARKQSKTQIAIVVGGGNIIRGSDIKGMDRVVADQIGMLATVQNAMALAEALEERDIPTIIQSAVQVAYARPINPKKARAYLDRGYIVIFAGGTGNPFVTTDTAAAVRAREIHADVLLKATNVEGVFTADPKKDKSAKLLKRVSYDEAYARGLEVMDLASLALCKEHSLPVIVFDLYKPKNLEKAIAGEPVGTWVSA
ncbi:UMP kinase [Candidatus Acetothermia bacterium]|nr:UMP kinase [Candidatus Acetothermia bacterium]MBI3659203.1 UMP kinase [Candidatus Acetothermia bacterium]